MEEGEITTPPTPSAPIDAKTPSPTSCLTFEFDNGGDGSRPGSGNGWLEVQEEWILRELQQGVNRYNHCFRRLRAVAEDLAALRRDNLRLAADNLHLAFLIAEFEAASAGDPYLRSPNAEAQGKELGLKEEGSDDREGVSAPLGGPPKSISIRSSDFLEAKRIPAKGVAAVATGGGDDGARQRHRLRLQPPQGGEEEEEGTGELEVEVYDQGTLKTELCNKWGEKGWCSYGERCRFAHGVEELRPVIRHPRYKTQLCRLLGPDGRGCPYGHRCHFRHALPGPRRA